MLTELCAELKNYFLRDRDADIHYGEYTISGGSIDLPFLLNGQYFRIVGSVLNDGVYQYPVDGLADEEFTGAVWAMAVPPAVVALAADIEAWRNKYESVDSMAMSPFTSETMPNVYSYTKESRNSTSGELTGWQKQFESRLSKLRRNFVL
jgi:hypothetical protein